MNFFRHEIYKYFLILCIALFFSNSIYSQSYQIRTYIEDDGLPSSTVYDITQDDSGRMWFATRGGIGVYDGFHWKIYSVGDGLPAPAYFRIKVDKKGIIWALTQMSDLSVSYFNGEKWLSLPNPDDSIILGESITSFGLATINNKTILAVGTNRYGLFVWTGSQWRHITPEDGLLSSSVNSIVVRDGEFFVATSRGLSIVRDDKVDNSLNEILDSPSPGIVGMAIEDKNDSSFSSEENPLIWLQGKDWLGCLEKGTFTLLSRDIKTLFTSSYGHLILQPDYQGGLYYGNPVAIFHFDSKTGLTKHLGKKNGLIAEGTTSMFIDREKNLWIGGLRGVSKIYSMRFANFQKEHGLFEDEVTAVLEAEPGTMIFGHVNGLTYYDVHAFRKVIFSKDKLSPSIRNRVLDLRKDPQGNIWAAISNYGVARIDRNGKINVYGGDKAKEISFSSVLVDKTGKVWAAGYSGVYYLEKGRFLPIRTGQLSRLGVRRIFHGPNNSICLATINAGIFIYSKDEWEQFLSTEGGSANSVYSILCDSQGRVWVGALAGLFHLNNGGLNRVNIGGFQIKRPVYFIIEDRKGRLWFGTDNSVIRWDGRNRKEYTIRDGLAGQETNRAAGFVDSQGRVWIGTNQGVSCYQEEFDDLNIPPPLVELLFLEVNEKKLSTQKLNKLSYNERNLVFHFRGISFADESGVCFKSKLEGFDKDWLPEYQSYGKQIRYTNLPAGRYHFLLKARNAGGVWSSVISSSEIIIKNPFWKEWWFYGIAFLFVGFIFFSVQRYFSEKRHSSVLEKQVSERTAKLQESEQRYRQSVENSPNPIFSVDRDGIILTWNRASANIFQYGQEMVGGKYQKLLSNPEDRTAIESMLAQVFQKHKLSDLDISYRCKDGNERYMVSRLYPLIDHKGRVHACVFANTDITERKEAEEKIRVSLKEKEVMLQEIHHRVKNNLQIISSLHKLQSSQINDKEILEAFVSSQGRIRSMALIHEKLYQSKDLAKVDFSEYIRGLTSTLFRSYKISENYVKLKVNVEDAFLDLNRSIPCGLVINELVSNALKHAFPDGRKGELVIDFRRERDNKFKLIVADNGVGFPEGLDFRNAESLGMRLVCILTEQLHGTVELNQKAGTKFEIRF